jgi:hypothetical protein
MFLRNATASQTVTFGPFLDDTDGKTAETALTIANTDIKINTHGSTSLANKTSGGGTHRAAGYYTAVLDATDTATIGRLQLSVSVAGALPVWKDYWVLPTALYDLYIGTDSLVTATTVTGAVWDEPLSSHTTGGTAGGAQNTIRKVLGQ